jgi:hypothetical protein
MTAWRLPARKSPHIHQRRVDLRFGMDENG